MRRNVVQTADSSILRRLIRMKCWFEALILKADLGRPPLPRSDQWRLRTAPRYAALPLHAVTNLHGPVVLMRDGARPGRYPLRGALDCLRLASRCTSRAHRRGRAATGGCKPGFRLAGLV